jgi:hypothetical protein
MCVLALGGVTVLGSLVSVAGERTWQRGEGLLHHSSGGLYVTTVV